MFLCWAIQIYLIICVFRVVASWLDLGESGGFLSAATMIAYSFTEPIYQTLRKVLPTPGELPLDLAPAVVIVVLGLIRSLVC